MKKIHLLFLFSIGLVLSVQAQKRTEKITALPHHLKISEKSQAARPMTTCVALNYNVADEGSYVIYIIEEDNGFVIGTNTYGDLEEAGTFEAPADVTYLTKVLIGFAFANSNIPANLSKTVNIKVYDLDALGFPQNQLATFPLTLGDIKKDVYDSAYTEIIFPTAIALPANKKFAVSVDISNLKWIYPTEMDSIGIYSLDVEPDKENFIGRLNDGTWFHGSQAWDLDFKQSLMIFPYVSDDPNCLQATPVKLSSFNAQKKDGYNEITWTTATEQNNSGFDLERSCDGNNFSLLATVSSKATAGNSNKTLHYAFQDKRPINGTNYYRLAQTDKDGRKTYSQVVSLNNLDLNAKIFEVYPNPVANTLNIRLSSSASSRVTFSIVDFSGRKIMSETKQVIPGENRLNLNVQQLQSGNYLLKMSTPGEASKIIKFVK